MGFLGAVAGFMVASAVWLAVVQPLNSPGLVWGGSVYHSKHEFKLYLKSKGLSYATWLRRNPGVAPWEPGRRVAEPGRRPWDWKRDALLAVNAALLAAIAAALLVRTRTREAVRGDVRSSGAVPPRASPVGTIARTLSHGLGYVEVGAGELTHAAVERVRHNREEALALVFGGGLAVAAGVVIVLLMS